MSNAISAGQLPRRPESLRHSRLSIAGRDLGSSYSPLLSSETASSFEDQQSKIDADDSSTRGLLHHRSYEIDQDLAEPYFPTEAAGDELRDDQESSYGLTNLRPRGTELSKSGRSTSTCQLAVDQGGWWKHQMLVDRSLRSMAALTSIFALIMVIVCISYMRVFVTRPNRNSTSVGGATGESCKTMEGRNVAIHLILNIAATMTLGMSNTFQTIVSSLNADELRWALSKMGDSRVGTNSPFNINHKKKGKLGTWLAWGLLISTSIPIHFLSNSIIGPSFYIEPPSTVTYTAMNTAQPSYSEGLRDDLGCWSAFRAGIYTFPANISFMNFYAFSTNREYSLVDVTYNEANCTQFRNTTTDLDLSSEYNSTGFSIGSCHIMDINCELGGHIEQVCRLNVRMEAALILAGCLTIKAAYMVMMMFRARRKVKTRCLTFGDVIVASALDPKLRIWNECLVNAGEGHRHQVSHQCHKHCTDSEPSSTGDNIGHCQKCKKFNSTDKAADLVHPVIAIKHKQSLISNLGLTAVTQMIILMFCSLTMMGFSIMIGVLMTDAAAEYRYSCAGKEQEDRCQSGLKTYLDSRFGGFGGFNSSVKVASFPPDSLGSELAAFGISNGAQFLYSLLYLLLIYNITLISMEHDWGKFERSRRRPRCTIVRGNGFDQSYFLQLPKKVIFPAMGFSALMHWMLGQAISTIETTWSDRINHTGHSQNTAVYASYPIWISTLLMLSMTGVCWWAFTYKREGFIPQMYGSTRACCSATTELDRIGREGIMWGDLTAPEDSNPRFRHAGFSSDEVQPIVPAELYCGPGSLHEKTL